MTAALASLDDLRRAYRATRTIAPSLSVGSTAGTAPRWAPATGERVLLVCGCGGGSGATTVALAMATASGRARVVEACGAATSGLGYAADAELGAVERGWLRGSRGPVVVERRADSPSSLDQLPAPAGSALPLTVVDSSRQLADLLASAGWLGQLARTAAPVVLVARATIPGLRRLAAAIELVGEARTVAAVVGPNRWPRPVEQAAAPAVRNLRDSGRLVAVPDVPALALTGLTPDPIPPAILRPARALLNLLEGPRS